MPLRTTSIPAPEPSVDPEGLILNTGTEVIFRSDSCQMRRQSDAAVSSAILTILFYAIAEDVFTTDQSERQ